MKPAFALDFRDNAVTLLHRTGNGWHQVGSVALDEPDLTAALSYLRATALGLSPRGITTKLVIPNDQILYTRVSVAATEPQARQAEIGAALEGRTPYALDELAYDWSGRGDAVQVAVIARETLAEAEAFATEHRFNPVGFVAIPEDGQFAGEPWFGATTLAPALLPAGDTVERDDVPVLVTTRVLPPAAPAPLPEPEPELIAEAVAAPEPGEEPEPEPQPDLPEPAPEQPDLPEPEVPIPQTFPETVPPTVPPTWPGTEPEDLPPELPEETPFELPEDWPSEEAGTGAASAPFAGAAFVQSFAPAPAERAAPGLAPPEPEDLLAADPDLNPAAAAPLSLAALDEAPMALDVVEDEPPTPMPDRPIPDGPLPDGSVPDGPVPARPVASVLDPAIEDDLPPMPGWTPAMGFASRRASETGGRAKGAPEIARPEIARPDLARPDLARPDPARPEPARPAAAKPAGGKAGIAKPAPGKAATRPGLAKPLAGAVERPAGARPLAAPPPRGGGFDLPTPDKPSIAATALKGAKGLGALVNAPGLPGRGKKKPPEAALPEPFAEAETPPAASPARPAAARPASPAFGGLGGRPMPVRGKPRHLGLILTGILLLCLALVAAWASIYIASSDDPLAVEEVQTAETAAPPAEDSTLPAAEDEMLADLQDPADFAPPEEGAETGADAGAETGAEAGTEPASGPAPVAAEIAAVAPPVGGAQDEILLATMDAPPAPADPLVLPQTEGRGDSLPLAQAAPPPFGTVYQFDESGLIVPTPEGIMTPEGVMLIAGKPPVVPLPRPASVLSAAAAAAPGADAPPTDPAEADPAPYADPALAGSRPRPRPANLVPPAAPEDDASLAPAADSRFATLRPRARPATITAATPPAAGDAARLASADASLAAQAGTQPTGPLTLSIARRPAARPADMSRAVEAAVASATRPQPQPDPAPQEAAPKPEPEAEEEPEVASAAPSIPTKASVAKQATFKNAIDLGKTNLIGVYGTPSRRYALVRSANGSYKKVKVGDRLDGGKVAAITDSELRYQKGSRLVVLKLPKG